jgi:hypothetical protein
LNISWDFDIQGRVIRKTKMFTMVVPSAGAQRDLFDVNNIIAKVYQPISDFLCRRWDWKMVYHSLYRLLGLWIEGKV